MKNQKLWIIAVLALTLASAPLIEHFSGGKASSKVPQTAASSSSEAGPSDEAIPAFSTVPIKYGASGQDVYELQGRLKHLGYFSGTIDSQFGSETLNSVKWFQWKFGMVADGVVGAKTKLRLYNATKNWRPTEPRTAKKTTQNTAELASGNTMGLSENDLRIMANAVYGEARGEPFEGQVAVAAVILNRTKSPSFPNTPSGVIFQPGAFTAVADGQIYLTPNEQASKAVRQALNGWDPTGGCLYYFNPKTATSKWIWTRPQVKTIGEHIFCM
ncbi:spore cortex-lytic enzyme [Paenibacillus zanthoxyli]|uniref:spore cortex-lytic enzyme n=1 Tax=Paenibacillus zanthoxyli TaxID=369399 RepID=UPI00046F6AC8|nr:spore cortex-lytic enzyme [Paenibacillus zanthoxyli]